MNSPSQPSMAEAIRLMAELQAALSGASGFKALLRRFGGVLGTRFGVQRIGFARVTGRRSKVPLKRRNVRAGAVEVLDDAAIARISDVFGAQDATARLAELRDGPAAFAVGDDLYSMTVVDD